MQSKWTEDEWNAYYEAEIEPVAVQFGEVYSVKLFTRKERGYGNRIVFDASNLQCASLRSKLELSVMVDRGAMTPNEWREALNMAPVEGGDRPIRRLDTEVVNLIENMLGKMNGENYVAVADMVKHLLKTAERNREDETQNKHPGRDDPERLQVVL